LLSFDFQLKHDISVDTVYSRCAAAFQFQRIYICFSPVTIARCVRTITGTQPISTCTSASWDLEAMSFLPYFLRASAGLLVCFKVPRAKVATVTVQLEPLCPVLRSLTQTSGLLSHTKTRDPLPDFITDLA
jgi:hypothetical protein